MTKTLGFLFASFLLLASSAAARAQTSVYGVVAVTNYGYKASNSNLVYYKDTAGFGAGVTHLFHSESRLKAGLDARFTDSPASNTGGYSAFGSLRIAFVPHQNPWSPYFHIGGGMVSTTYPAYYTSTSTTTVARTRMTGGALLIGGGVNVRTSDRWSIRVIELSGSGGTRVGSASLSTGVIYTF